jgi:hypothetical protein
MPFHCLNLQFVCQSHSCLVEEKYGTRNESGRQLLRGAKYSFHFHKPSGNIFSRNMTQSMGTGVTFQLKIPCSPDSSGQAIFDRKGVCRFQIASLDPDQRSGLARSRPVKLRGMRSLSRFKKEEQSTWRRWMDLGY